MGNGLRRFRSFDGYTYSLAISSTSASHGGRWPLSAVNRSRTGATTNSALHASGAAEIAGLAAAAVTPATIPLWTGTGAPNFPDDQFLMVGLDPTVPQKNPVSTIKAQVIPVKFVF